MQRARLVLQTDPEELPRPRRQILCNIPLDLTIDELVTSYQITGDRRLADALASAIRRAWDALPFAAGSCAGYSRNCGARRRPPRVGSPKAPLRHIEILLGFGVFNDCGLEELVQALEECG
jgi:hypothetical protein